MFDQAKPEVELILEYLKCISILLCKWEHVLSRHARPRRVWVLFMMSGGHEGLRRPPRHHQVWGEALLHTQVPGPLTEVVQFFVNHDPQATHG